MLPSKTKDLGHVLMKYGGIHLVYHQIVYVFLQFSNICITCVVVPSLGSRAEVKTAVNHSV
jgi:hypothetical protein